MAMTYKHFRQQQLTRLMRLLDKGKLVTVDEARHPTEKDGKRYETVELSFFVDVPKVD